MKVLPTSYPTGAEKVLIQLINGRIVPEGGLPAGVGVIVQNVTTLWFIAKYLRRACRSSKNGLRSTGAVKTPGNFEVPIGGTIEEVIERLEDSRLRRKNHHGGPMMGVAVDDITRPILSIIMQFLVSRKKRRHSRKNRPVSSAAAASAHADEVDAGRARQSGTRQ